jgi:hypothetical protein
MTRPAITTANGKHVDGYLCTCGRSGNADFVTHLLEVAETDRMNIPDGHAAR